MEVDKHKAGLVLALVVVFLVFPPGGMADFALVNSLSEPDPCNMDVTASPMVFTVSNVCKQRISFLNVPLSEAIKKYDYTCRGVYKGVPLAYASSGYSFLGVSSSSGEVIPKGWSQANCPITKSTWPVKTQAPTFNAAKECINEIGYSFKGLSVFYNLSYDADADIDTTPILLWVDNPCERRVDQAGLLFSETALKSKFKCSVVYKGVPIVFDVSLNYLNEKVTSYFFLGVSSASGKVISKGWANANCPQAKALWGGKTSPSTLDAAKSCIDEMGAAFKGLTLFYVEEGSCIPPAPTTEDACASGADEDNDGFTDCKDLDCVNSPDCPTETGDPCNEEFLPGTGIGFKKIDGITHYCKNRGEGLQWLRALMAACAADWQCLSQAKCEDGLCLGTEGQSCISASFCTSGYGCDAQSKKCTVEESVIKEVCSNALDDDGDELTDCADVNDCLEKVPCELGKWCSQSQCIFSPEEGNYDGLGEVGPADIAAIKVNPAGFWDYVGKSVQKANGYLYKMVNNWGQ